MFCRLSLYLKLIRFDKPIGSVLLIWPCLWGIAHAYHTQNVSIKACIVYAILLSAGAIIMRSLGCIINDLADRDVDKKVERTRERPLACGTLTQTEALLCAAVLGMAGLAVFCTIPRQAQWFASLGGILLILYPFMKRITHYPQVVLGCAFNVGVLVGYSCLVNAIDATIACLFLCGVCWTIAYDTIYAFQDIQDDKMVGVKSMAVRFENAPKMVVAICYGIGFVFLMCAKPIGMNHYIYILFSLWSLQVWKPRDPQSCNAVFKAHAIGSVFGIL